MNTPNRGIPYVPEGTLDPAAGLNLALDFVDPLLQSRVIRMDLTAPPGTGADGDSYVVASPATGAWAGLEDWLVVYRAEGDFWQAFEPGVAVNLVLNADDLNLYRFDAGVSPGGWVLAAGLGDAPNDGHLYGRRNEAWEVVPDPGETGGGSLEVSDEGSPPAFETDVTAIVFGDGLDVEILSDGVVRVTAAPQAAAPPAVVNTSASNLNATTANAGDYTRFSHVSPTYTFNDGLGYVTGAEYHGRYVGAGSLLIVGTTGMTINPPADGTLEIPPGGTFTVKIIDTDEADLFGVTVPA